MGVIFKINSLEQEKERVKETKGKIAWLKERGYFFVLPEQSLEVEYNFEDYKDKVSIIEKKWLEIEKDFFEKLKRIFNNEFSKSFEVYFTKYGTGGSYFLPNKIIMNISDEYRTSADYKTISHEIIHLSLEPLIQKYKIEHWQKERTVDLIASKIIPNYNLQKIPVDIHSVDESFNKFFPDIEEIIKNLQ